MQNRRLILSVLRAAILAAFCSIALAPPAPAQDVPAADPSPAAPPPAADAAEPPLTGTAAPPAVDGAAPAAGATVAAAAPAAKLESPRDVVDGVSAGMPVWKLAVFDLRDVITAPIHWHASDWTLFSIEIAGIAGVSQADRQLRRIALRGHNAFENHLSDVFEPLGSYAAFGILGGFYVSGLAFHDTKSQEVALDGLIAVTIGPGLLTNAVKEVVGRSRPNTNRGPYSFHPFHGVSFPSGHVSQGFAVGSVIAAEYPNRWVEIIAYGSATLVGFARMRHDAHWFSDVVGGALLGDGVGRTVVRINTRRRARLRVAPLLAPQARGLTLVTSF